jgi:hypothetical protein
MRRALPILLLLAFGAFGTGGLRFVHELDHASDDHAHHHDESECFVHAKLNLPMLAGGVTPVLVCAGALVAFLALLTVPVLCRRPVLLLNPRGPPVI